MALKNENTKKTLVQIFKFIAFSLGAGIIQTVTFTLMREVAGLEYNFSYLTALVLSVLYNFTLNRRFTFKSASNVPIAMLKVFAFYCVFTPVSLYLGDYFSNLAKVNYPQCIDLFDYLILAVTMLSNLVLEFLYCRFFVYRNSIDTNSLAKKDKEKEAEKK